MGKKYVGIKFLVALLLLTLTMWPMMSRSHAVVPSLDQIRVSLFIDARGTVPSVTLSAATGLTIGSRQSADQSASITPWLTHGSSVPIRASLDQYMVFIMETYDAVVANSIAQQLQGLAGEAYVFTQKRAGHFVYRVYVGQYLTEQQAMVDMDRLAKLTLLEPYELAVTGPKHWQAGTYATKDAAMLDLEIFWDHGLHGFLVYSENNDGQLTYHIWLGEAANEQELARVKEQVQLIMPSLDLQPIDEGRHYLLVREQMKPSLSSQPVAHYFFSAQSGQKVWVSTEAETIRVAERNGRSYRGHIELSAHQGRLAVINELPFEQYLYSVVGSEMNETWPMEALKAQAVAARTFALAQGIKYGIAHVSDTTYEQAYYGVGAEYDKAIAAVQATAGEVIVDDDGLITAYYHSNAGGMTADTSEIWQTPLDYVQSLPSPDQIAAEGLLPWYRVVLPNGLIGYVRSDFTEQTGEVNKAGYPILVATESNVNVRPAPYVNNNANAPIAKLEEGDRLILFEETLESNAFSWVQGPYTGEQLQQSINGASSHALSEAVRTLKITERGPSGRVLELVANGQQVQVNAPDRLRLAMNGLQSTRFDVEETGRYTVLGAEGLRQFPLEPSEPGGLYVLSGSGDQGDGGDHSGDHSEGSDATAHVTATQATDSALFVLNGKGETRLITQQPQFRFVGLGFGHGIGMSQWGARELAEFLEYDYKDIIAYYYAGVRIVKTAS